MLASNEGERSRLFAVIDTEVRSKEPADRISLIHESVYSYLLEKVQQLPKDIFYRESFENESGIFSTQVIETNELKLWSGRIIEPDITVPGRQWTVELLIGEANNRVTFASRLGCFSRSMDFYFEPGAPRVYKNGVKNGILFGDGIKLSIAPLDIRDDDELDLLLALINNKNRTRNIIVLSCDNEGRCLLKPYAFTNRLCAIAHVVRLYPSASFKLSRLIGKHFSVFDAGVRIYRPTSKLEADEPFRHPLYTRHRLEASDAQRVQHAICPHIYT